ncbi:MAG: MltA domain-containing protein [Pseudomonadota bacterium]
MIRVFCLLVTILAAACVERPTTPPPVTTLALSELEGFSEAALLPAVETFIRTCPRLLSKRARGRLAGLDWTSACQNAGFVITEEDAHAFLVTTFDAVMLDGGDALITGYFEPVFPGSASPTEEFSAPLLARPDDLVSVDLGTFRSELSGQRLAGRVEAGRLVPFADRAAIEANPPESAEILGYMHPDDLFFLQIQGSGVVDLASGPRRIGYAAQNGHSYVAIGKTLVDEGIMPIKQVTMQSIRAWLAAAPPTEAARVRASNPSYVFFQDRGPADDEAGPLGSAGVPLIPRVSAAVDPLVIPLGAPVWIDGADEGFVFQGLTIAQDTGGAIKGSGRVDLFLGRGDEAGAIAGALKLPARMVVLIPKSEANAFAALP